MTAPKKADKKAPPALPPKRGNEAPHEPLEGQVFEIPGMPGMRGIPVRVFEMHLGGDEGPAAPGRARRRMGLGTAILAQMLSGRFPPGMMGETDPWAKRIQETRNRVKQIRIDTCLNGATELLDAAVEMGRINARHQERLKSYLNYLRTDHRGCPLINGHCEALLKFLERYDSNFIATLPNENIVEVLEAMAAGMMS